MRTQETLIKEVVIHIGEKLPEQKLLKLAWTMTPMHQHMEILA